MKNIAVLIHSLTVEYSVDVLTGIADYFKDRTDIRLLIGQTKEPHCKVGISDYQCWSAKDLLTSDDVDAVIVVSGSYSSTMTMNDLGSYLKDFSKKKPVISVGLDLGLKNSYYTHVDCKTAYAQVLNHLIKEHGCKRFAFMGANQTKSAEALERFEAFTNALKQHDIEFDDDYFLDATFTSVSAYEVFKDNYKTKESVNFDALFAANDLMAIGCMRAMQELGIEIPKDVKVIGFDETTFASTSSPKLSTIDQNIYNQGYEAASMVESILKGNNVERIREIPVSPVYRQSCGCIPLENTYDVFRTEAGRILTGSQKTHSNVRINGSPFYFLKQLDDVYTLFDMVRSDSTLKQFFYSLKYLMGVSGINAMAICFYDAPITVKREEDFKLPSKATVSMFVNNDENIQLFEPNVSVNPRKNLFPKRYFTKIPGNYIIVPVYSGQKNYGYIICTLKNNSFSIYTVLLRIIINALTQSYELTLSMHQNEILSEQNIQLKKNNSSLDLQSKTDELTKILNRRGFMELAERTIGIALEMESTGLVMFFDMDGLKTINDTYGHKMGDRALKAMATVLAKTLRANDVVGRLSGDEFGAVAVGMTESQIEKIRTKMVELCKEISEEKAFPFTLSCSVGVTEFNSQHKSLKSLLIAADKQLYIEKHQKHEKLKQTSH